MLNTRFDYEYARKNDMPNWKDSWLALLERWVVEGNELVEDQSAPIFRLGFTVAEVAEAVGFSGYTPRQLEWYQGQPDRYQLDNGQYVEAADYPAKRLASAKEEMQQANKAACTARILGRYPAPIQQSAALGVYPVDVRDTMVEFIAACIAEENRLFDLIEAATALNQLAAISPPTWPEWPKE
jgi:hypothetical protein